MKQKYKIKVNKQYLEMLFLVLPNLIPYAFTQNQLLHFVLVDIYFYVALICFIIYLWKSICKFKFSLPLLGILLFVLSEIFSTRINGISILSLSLHFIRVIAVCIIVEAVARQEKRLEIFLMVVRDITVFFLMLNIIVSVIYPNGIPSISDPNNARYLFGNVNSTIRSIYPGMCCSLLLDVKKDKISWNTWIIFAGYILLSATTYVMATGLVTMTFIIVAVIFRKLLIKKIRQIYCAIVCLVAVSEILIVILNNQSVMLMISTFFHKSATFTNRFYLWNNALSLIPNKLFWGYGRPYDVDLKAMIGNMYGTHNYYLDVIFMQGIVGLTILLILIILPIFWYKKNMCNEEIYVLSIIMCGIYIMFLFEPFISEEQLYMPILYMLLLLLRDHKCNLKRRNLI